VRWRFIAKDGADLPPHQVRVQSSALTTSPGETFDLELPPQAPGIMVLKYDMVPGDTSTIKRAIIRVH